MVEQTTQDRPLRVCYFGTYRAAYTRNQIVLKGLQSQRNVNVYVCHETLWQGIGDRVEQASGGWLRPGFWARVLSVYGRLIRRHSQMPDYDVMLIGYPGQFDAFLARVLAGRRKRPVALDVLMSLHLVAEERGLTTQHATTARLLFWLEQHGLRQPDRLVAENREYQAYIAQKYDLPEERFRRVPHGADESVYYPRDTERRDVGDCFRVTYHGGFLPSHGVNAILEAALHLQDRPEIQFHFYGSGPEKARIVAAAQASRLSNVVFHGFVEEEDLLYGIAASDICLGVFGTTRQALFTVQNKVWEALAMARPVISGDAATVREFLTDREEIYLVPREDGEALATAILHLQAHPQEREAMANAGYQRYLAGNSTQAIGRQMAAVLRDLVADGRR